MNALFELRFFLGAGMRSIVNFMVAFGLIWVGVLESATSSVEDFRQDLDDGDVEPERSVKRILAVGLVGSSIVSSIIINGRQTVILEGHEKFLDPNPMLSESFVGSE